MSEKPFRSLFRRLATERSVPYAMGWDAAVSGPDTTNCHFATFGTPETMRQWQAGKEAGELFKQGPSLQPGEIDGKTT